MSESSSEEQGMAFGYLLERSDRAGGSRRGDGRARRPVSAPATLFRGDFTARFALALAHKDFGLAGDLARHHLVPTRLLDLCQMELQEAMNRGWGDQDRLKASTLQG